MHPLLARTFGGLTRAYYFRQLFFALLFPALSVFIFSRAAEPMPVGAGVFVIVSTLLYPYARFVYESVMGFLTGANVFFVNAILMLLVKLLTMMLCWFLALLIAPIGLAYLYYQHSKIAPPA